MTLLLVFPGFTQVAGSGSSSSVGSGLLSVSVPLVGVGQAVRGEGPLGDLVLGGPSSVTFPALTSSVGSGLDLILEVLSGSGLSSSSGSASLTVLVPLTGSGITDSSVLGSLSVAIPLSGAGVSSSVTGGVLSVSIPLAGGSVTFTRGMASLVVSVPLAGSGTTDSSVLGSLFVGIPLSGSGTTSSRATGFVADQFSGAGKGRSTASGTLTTWVYLHSDDGYGNSHVGSELAVYPLASILLATVGYVTRGTTSRGSGRLKRRITGTITDSGQVSPTSVFGVVEDEELVGEVVGVG